MAIIGTPAAIRGQAAPPPPDFAALTAALDAPDVSTRATAVAILATIPPITLPSATRVKLILLLEREAATAAVAETREDDGEDSETGLYLVELVRTVVRLQEPASVRGLAMLGIQTSLAAQRFVAAQGDTAVALLAQAERADTNSVGVVAETRGLMLGEYSSRLSPAARSVVRASLLATAATDPMAFAQGAEYARLIEATPVVEAHAAAATTELGRAILADAAAKLAALRVQATTAEVLAALTTSIAAICGGATAERLHLCQWMVERARLATDHLRDARSTAAQQALRTLAAAATDAARRGIITPTEGTMIAGTATYLVTRI
jgi:hypothetical protein